MIIPNKLKKGDTIGIIAPSNPIINENIDVILCVSRCTKRIVLENGFNDKKIKVSYIGTKVAENIKYKSPNNDQKLNIAYLGYANEQKGYYFFIDAFYRSG